MFGERRGFDASSGSGRAVRVKRSRAGSWPVALAVDALPGQWRLGGEAGESDVNILFQQTSSRKALAALEAAHEGHDPLPHIFIVEDESLPRRQSVERIVR